jgi:hypothetical protein
MRHRDFEGKIDDYLLGRLSEEDAGRFESHYFDCPDCFRQTAERAALLAAVKSAGPALAVPGRAAEPGKSGFRPAAGRFRFGWAAAGAAVLVLAAAVLFWPRPEPAPANFERKGSDVVRGGTLTLLAPLGAVQNAPQKFSWNPIPGAAEYTIIVEGIDPAWTASIRNTSIAPTADVAGRFVPGKSYTWRVKAYSAQGIMIANSTTTEFHIGR